MPAITGGPGVPKAASFLSPAVLDDNSHTLYLSGQCGVDLEGNFIEGTVSDRTKQTMRNIAAVLKAAGMGVEDIVSTTIYLSAYTKDFETMNKAYVESFPRGMALPARTCIGVAALPKGTDVEITCIAVKKQKSKL
ncbi:endoribonuclease L-PSP [Rhodotorula toruloides]|uniref:Endoribonuclease L-PSP n=1 Tax=Rhodotorula toruloides TaxID=5286 RepID=A0A511KBL1_RHOTO|nr:endoribonuclease L-PSP [Rhodotorula toruloides]